MAERIDATSNCCTGNIEASESAPRIHHPSDARIPGVPGFRRRRTQSLPDIFQGIREGDPRHELDALVTKLPGYLHPDWSTVFGREFLSVHGICDQRLRMPGIGHVHTVPGRVER